MAAKAKEVEHSSSIECYKEPTFIVKQVFGCVDIKTVFSGNISSSLMSCIDFDFRAPSAVDGCPNSGT